MEPTPIENADRLNPNAEKDEISSSGSGERRGKKKFLFLTKSLAEVYVQQGQISMALEIYGRMLEINPTDHEIEKRIAELEAHPFTRRSMKVKEPDVST